MCCIYHRPRAYDESSDSDSSDSSSDEDSSCDEGPSSSGGGDGCGKNGRGCGHGKKSRRKPKPNAYEKMPKYTGRRGGNVLKQ